MKSQSVEQFVVSLVKATLPSADGRAVTPDLDFVDDLNADSLSLVSMIYTCGEKFGFGTDDLGGLMYIFVPLEI